MTPFGVSNDHNELPFIIKCNTEFYKYIQILLKQHTDVVEQLLSSGQVGRQSRDAGRTPLR
jgi:hypothetical protein